MPFLALRSSRVWLANSSERGRTDRWASSGAEWNINIKALCALASAARSPPACCQTSDLQHAAHLSCSLSLSRVYERLRFGEASGDTFWCVVPFFGRAPVERQADARQTMWARCLRIGWLVRITNRICRLSQASRADRIRGN
jgi:hypothetical protein